jgi:hypothetical protein
MTFFGISCSSGSILSLTITLSVPISVFHGSCPKWGTILHKSICVTIFNNFLLQYYSFQVCWIPTHFLSHSQWSGVYVDSHLLPRPAVSARSGGPPPPPIHWATHWFCIGHHPNWLDEVCPAHSTSHAWKRQKGKTTDFFWLSLVIFRFALAWSNPHRQEIDQKNDIHVSTVALMYSRWDM